MHERLRDPVSETLSTVPHVLSQKHGFFLFLFFFLNWAGDSLGHWVRELGWLDTLCTCVWIAEAWSNFSLKRESHVFVKAHVAQWIRSLTPGSVMHLAQVQSCSSWCDTEAMIYLKVLLLEGWCQYKRMGHKSQEEPFDLMASGLGGSGLSTEIKEPLLANYKI